MTKQLEMNVDLNKKDENKEYEVHLYSKDDPLCWQVAHESLRDMCKELEILEKLIDKNTQAQGIVEKFLGKKLSASNLRVLKATPKYVWPKEILDPLYELYLDLLCKQNPGVWISTIDLDYFRELGDDLKMCDAKSIAAFVEKSEKAYETRKLNKAKKMYVTEYEETCAWYEDEIANNKNEEIRQECIDDYKLYKENRQIVLKGTNEQIVDMMA